MEKDSSWASCARADYTEAKGGGGTEVQCASMYVVWKIVTETVMPRCEPRVKPAKPQLVPVISTVSHLCRDVPKSLLQYA